MKNITELSLFELESITGGATFAYRVGQFIRWAGYSALPGGHARIAIEMEYLP